ncbi:MAG: 3-deoxy-7-phosphoheptulonate synthase [Gammaproteobacteria bacterium]|nr:3-deoxy-7-phosphoheptulonate synthase [Gammaproteobacteria bacterium]MCY4218690.1 3-deoxy-7-phosphoheptulonate synthase [Gammaproteobacteria bacterium]MCY4273826.1 3-deoxy-7-phosphoheptulonate synthase [Gammaproteobacteria bacterium]
MNKNNIDDLRIAKIQHVINPNDIYLEIPISEKSAELTLATRKGIQDILNGKDDRLLIVSGPCSIHDPKAALDYANKLLEMKNRLKQDLLIVMRVYFEKPRTTVGWKGLINDPDLDNSFNINKGLRLARQLLLDLNELGIPAGTEYLDIITPQYVADLISWGAIGARTTESQVHREVVSGLSCPVGLKNGTNGNLDIAVDGIRAACHPHHFLSLTKDGHSAIFTTTGNSDCHIILRGGREPNFDAQSVHNTCSKLEAAGLRPQVMIDFSHANSKKIPDNQIAVAKDVAKQISNGDKRIIGVMIESHLVAGRQDVENGVALQYGQSITDACISFEQTKDILNDLAEAVQVRRNAGISS